MIDLKRALHKPEFPRSSAYDPEWVLDNQMGPNALWLLEWLCASLDLQPGMRVLDLGCGKAMTSVFLAKEFGVNVIAADLWMSPDHNWRRVVEAGVADRVCPIKAEAHTLPFAAGYFDAILSVDAFQYFGTDELYIDYLSRFVRPGGALGVALVGLTKPLQGDLPRCLTTPQSNGKVFWEPSCRCFKPPHFWQRLWRDSPMLSDVRVEAMEDGWRHWRDFEQTLEMAGKGIFPSDAQALEQDRGETLALLKLLARRTELEGENFYDPSLGAKVGVDV
ncbi:methyltransferase domain-containing protein [Myxococcota bacterium]|nr:methyltransferase domain-containing protein [Myxococcota bacterium]MBU1430861.1 methyltransferase domain-containing protein [Myxococcota bacterium]MBU1899338.1 methyltransferase domain-containing protein [Myxococcota bacterium]